MLFSKKPFYFSFLAVAILCSSTSSAISKKEGAKVFSWAIIASLIPDCLETLFQKDRPLNLDTTVSTTFCLGAVFSALSSLSLFKWPTNKFLQSAHTASKIMTAASGIVLGHLQEEKAPITLWTVTKLPFLPNARMYAIEAEPGWWKPLAYYWSSLGILGF